MSRHIYLFVGLVVGVFVGTLASPTPADHLVCHEDEVGVYSTDDPPFIIDQCVPFDNLLDAEAQ